MQPIAMTSIRLVDWETIIKDGNSKLTVVDLWASWCVSCIEGFPDIVALHERYNKRGVRFLSLNLDQQDDTRAIRWSNDFLNEINARFEHYHLKENMLAAFEQLDLIGIPVVLFYDDKGIEILRLSGDDPNNQFEKADIELAIRRFIES